MRCIQCIKAGIMIKYNGSNLRKLREDHGYSIRAFAQLIYVSKTTLQRWESSFVPADSPSLDKIAQVLGLTSSELAAILSGKSPQECASSGDSAGANADGGGVSSHLSEEERLAERELDRAEAEKLAETKFGVRGIAIALAVLCALGLISSFLPYFF